MAKKIKFEVALEKLDSIIKELESGSLDLDRMIKLYEEGKELTQLCQLQLAKVEEKISMIEKDGDKLIEKTLNIK